MVALIAGLIVANYQEGRRVVRMAKVLSRRVRQVLRRRSKAMVMESKVTQVIMMPMKMKRRVAVLTRLLSTLVLVVVVLVLILHFIVNFHI